MEDDDIEFETPLEHWIYEAECNARKAQERLESLRIEYRQILLLRDQWRYRLQLLKKVEHVPPTLEDVVVPTQIVDEIRCRTTSHNDPSP